MIKSAAIFLISGLPAVGWYAVAIELAGLSMWWAIGLLTLAGIARSATDEIQKPLRKGDAQ